MALTMVYRCGLKIDVANYSSLSVNFSLQPKPRLSTVKL